MFKINFIDANLENPTDDTFNEAITWYGLKKNNNNLKGTSCEPQISVNNVLYQFVFVSQHWKSVLQTTFLFMQYLNN